MKVGTTRQMFLRGYTSDPLKRCVVRLEVDQDKLFDKLACKALRSKGRKATCLFGAVVVKIVEEHDK